MARKPLLLTGDIEQRQEAQLVAAGAPLKADVLLVPHHGSKTSSSGGLPRCRARRGSRWCRPATATASAIRPPDVLARYAERGMQVIDTPHCGAAHWQSAQPQQTVCERALRQRYWQHQPGLAR